MNRYPHISSAFYDTPWYLTPQKMLELDAFLRPRLAGGVRFEISDAQLAQWRAERAAAQARAQQNSRGGVAVISIYGVITQRADMFTDMSGGTSIERLAKLFRAALADPEIKAIVFDVDSPGGSVFGVEELAKEIFEARGQKKTYAVVNSLMASAAYYIASAAGEVIASPSSDTGSIGVLSLHADFSKQLEAAGIKPTFITYGKYKAEGNELEPLSDDARAFWQQRVDEYGEMFVKAVARNRGVSPEEVRKDFGQGRAFGAKEAKQRGMVDRIATFDETLARLGVNVTGTAVAAIKAESERCPKCKGWGHVWTECEAEGGTESSECPACGGTGEVAPGEGRVAGREVAPVAAASAVLSSRAEPAACPEPAERAGAAPGSEIPKPPEPSAPPVEDPERSRGAVNRSAEAVLVQTAIDRDRLI